MRSSPFLLLQLMHRFLCQQSHIVLLQSVLRGWLSFHFRGTVCVLPDVPLLLYFHVFSGLSVFVFLIFQAVYVQLRQNVLSGTHKGAVPRPAAQRVGT